MSELPPDVQIRAAAIQAAANAIGDIAWAFGRAPDPVRVTDVFKSLVEQFDQYIRHGEWTQHDTPEL